MAMFGRGLLPNDFYELPSQKLGSRQIAMVGSFVGRSPSRSDLPLLPFRSVPRTFDDNHTVGQAAYQTTTVAATSRPYSDLSNNRDQIIEYDRSRERSSLPTQALRAHLEYPACASHELRTENDRLWENGSRMSTTTDLILRLNSDDTRSDSRSIGLLQQRSPQSVINARHEIIESYHDDSSFTLKRRSRSPISKDIEKDEIKKSACRDGQYEYDYDHDDDHSLHRDGQYTEQGSLKRSSDFHDSGPTDSYSNVRQHWQRQHFSKEVDAQGFQDSGADRKGDDRGRFDRENGKGGKYHNESRNGRKRSPAGENNWGEKFNKLIEVIYNEERNRGEISQNKGDRNDEKRDFHGRSHVKISSASDTSCAGDSFQEKISLDDERVEQKGRFDRDGERSQSEVKRGRNFEKDLDYPAQRDPDRDYKRNRDKRNESDRNRGREKGRVQDTSRSSDRKDYRNRDQGRSHDKERGRSRERDSPRNRDRSIDSRSRERHSRRGSGRYRDHGSPDRSSKDVPWVPPPLPEHLRQIAISQSLRHPVGAQSGSRNISVPAVQNQFQNDGSFLEMFQRMQEARQLSAISENSNTSDGPASDTGSVPGTRTSNVSLGTPEQPAPSDSMAPLIVKRRFAKILKTGVVHKKKTVVEAGDAKDTDAWSRYMSEVQKYRANKCIEDETCHPLMK